MLHVTLFYRQTIHSLNFLDPACLPNAFSAETSTGESVFAQLLTGGIPKFALVVLAISWVNWDALGSFHLQRLIALCAYMLP
jgi:hypothetical protein